MADNIVIGKSLRVNGARPLDYLYGPYESIEALKKSIPIILRYKGLTGAVLDLESGRVTEYWFKSGVSNDDLVEKFPSVESSQADWLEENENDPSYIWNKPDLSVYLTEDDLPNSYILPPATTEQLGGIIVGNGLSITSEGVLSLSSDIIDMLSHIDDLYERMFRILVTTTPDTVYVGVENQQIVIETTSSLIADNINILRNGTLVWSADSQTNYWRYTDVLPSNLVSEVGTIGYSVVVTVNNISRTVDKVVRVKEGEVSDYVTAVRWENMSLTPSTFEVGESATLNKGKITAIYASGNEEDVTAIAEIVHAGATLSGNTYSTDTAGQYSIYAKYQGIMSNEYISVLVTDPALLPVTMRWSATTHNTYLGSEDPFPTLTVEGVDNPIIYYSSSDSNIASIDSSSNITLNSQGQCTITASYLGDNRHASSSASYTLVVGAARLTSIDWFGGISPSNIVAGGQGDFTLGSVIAHYTDGSTKDVTALANITCGRGRVEDGVYYAPSSVGGGYDDVSVEYTENGITKSVKQRITLSADSINYVTWTGMSVSPNPITVGETATLDKGTVTAVYLSGNTVDVTDDSNTHYKVNGNILSGNTYIPNTEGTYEFTCDYNGTTARGSLSLVAKNVVPVIPDYYVGWTNGTKKAFASKSVSELTSSATTYSIGSPSYSEQCQDIIFYVLFRGSNPPTGSLSSGGLVSPITANDFLSGGDCPHSNVVINNETFKVYGTRNTDYPIGNNIMTINF